MNKSLKEDFLGNTNLEPVPKLKKDEIFELTPN